MASAKDVVANFMELGAKYEVVLVGLADEVTKQREIVESAKSDASKSAESATSAAMRLEATRDEVGKVLAQVREIAIHVEATRELTENTLRALEDRLCELTAADQHQSQSIERLSKMRTRDILVVGTVSVITIILSLVALLGH